MNLFENLQIMKEAKTWNFNGNTYNSKKEIIDDIWYYYELAWDNIRENEDKELYYEQQLGKCVHIYVSNYDSCSKDEFISKLLEADENELIEILEEVYELSFEIEYNDEFKEDEDDDW